MGYADLVLPELTFLETWGTDIPEPGRVTRSLAFSNLLLGQLFHATKAA
jgi:anaerobic selenocysteine-containing dehydrogenase